MMESPDVELSHHVSFWVVRVPEAVFSTDPQDSLRVSYPPSFVFNSMMSNYLLFLYDCVNIQT